MNSLLKSVLAVLIFCSRVTFAVETYAVVDSSGNPTGVVLSGEMDDVSWLDSAVITESKGDDGSPAIMIDGNDFSPNELFELGITVEKISKPGDGGDSDVIKKTTKLDYDSMWAAIQAFGGVHGQAFYKFTLEHSDVVKIRIRDPSILHSAVSVEYDSVNAYFIIYVENNIDPFTACGVILDKFLSDVLPKTISQSDFLNAYRSVLMGTDSVEDVYIIERGQAIDMTGGQDPKAVLSQIQALTRDMSKRVAVMAAHNVADALSIGSTVNAWGGLVVNFVLWKNNYVGSVDLVLAALPVLPKGTIATLAYSGSNASIAITRPVLGALGKARASVTAGGKNTWELFVRFAEEVDLSIGKKEIADVDRPFIDYICENLLCVEPSTLVLTPKGEQRIDSLRIGDYVYSYNEISKSIEPNRVLKKFESRAVSELVKLTLVNDGQNQYYDLTTTANHPFAVLDDDGEVIWKNAGSLSPKDRLKTISGISIVVVKERQPISNVISIIVEKCHNYFVGKVPTLSHNGVCFTKAFVEWAEQRPGALRSDLVAFIADNTDRWPYFRSLVYVKDIVKNVSYVDRNFVTMFKRQMRALAPGMHELIPLTNIKYIIQVITKKEDGYFASLLISAMDKARIETKKIRFNNLVSKKWPNGTGTLPENIGFAPGPKGTKIELGHICERGIRRSPEGTSKYHAALCGAFRDAIIDVNGRKAFSVTNWKKAVKTINTQFFVDKITGQGTMDLKLTEMNKAVDDAATQISAIMGPWAK